MLRTGMHEHAWLCGLNRLQEFAITKINWNMQQYMLVKHLRSGAIVGQ